MKSLLLSSSKIMMIPSFLGGQSLCKRTSAHYLRAQRLLNVDPSKEKAAVCCMCQH